MSLEWRDLRSFNVLKYGFHCLNKSYYTCVWEESLSEYDMVSFQLISAKIKKMQIENNTGCALAVFHMYYFRRSTADVLPLSKSKHSQKVQREKRV